MEHIEALVALNLTGCIGSHRLNALQQVFPDPASIFCASKERIASVPGIGEAVASRIKTVRPETVRKEFDFCRSNQVQIVPLSASAYPAALRCVQDAPLVLYVQGRLSEEDILSVAVVGSRRATFYGRTQAGKLSAGLVQNGLTVVSGMARGIDTFAHRAALNAAGRTIAVIGSGFNYLYPEENMDLAQKICSRGAVVSEFPVFTPPLACNFPRRNRIISGLCLGVLVVEAAANSGALITADFALQQGREVFALPADIDSPNAAGVNKLISQGAKLVSSVQDIIEEFDFLFPLSGQARQDSQRELKPYRQNKKALSCTESALCNIISASERPLCFDELLERSQLDISALSHALARLEVLGLVHKLAGGVFQRAII